jgi:ABC-type transporter Mla MlaB component
MEPNPVITKFGEVATESEILSELSHVRLLPDGSIVRTETGLPGKFEPKGISLPGVYYDGTCYFDLKSINYINHTGMAILIEIMKKLLKKNIEVLFLNANAHIKSKIKAAGLEEIINCKQTTDFEEGILL